MKKQYIFGIVAILVIALGWWLYSSGNFFKTKLVSKQTIGVSGGSVGTSGEESNARIKLFPETLDKNVEMEIKSIAKSEWPAGTIGGLYEIEPSGTQFVRNAIFTFSAKVAAGKHFSIGYWLPEKNKWEYIPTLKIGPDTYRAAVAHLSKVGGHEVTPEEAKQALEKLENDPNTPNAVRELAKQLKPLLDELTKDQATGSTTEAEEAEKWEFIQELFGRIADYALGFADRNPDIDGLKALLDALELAQTGLGNDETIARLHGIFDTLLNNLIKDAIDKCKKNPGVDSQRNLLRILEIADMAGVDDGVLEELNEALEKQCKKEEKPTFKIEQTDNIPFTVSMPGVGSSKGTAIMQSVGRISGKPKDGDALWQSSWEVIQDSSINANTTVQLNLLNINSNALSTEGQSTDRIKLSFNLQGVKVGQTFPITMTRIGTYTQSNYTSPQEFIIHADDLTFKAKIDDSSQDTIGAGKVLTLEGKLQESLGKDGKDGAIIAFTKFPFEFPGLSMQIPPLLIIPGELSLDEKNNKAPDTDTSKANTKTPSSEGSKPIKGSLPQKEKKEIPIPTSTGNADLDAFLKAQQEVLKSLQ